MKLLLLFSILFLSFCSFGQNITNQWKILENGTPEERIASALALKEYYNGENKDSLRSIGETLFFYGIDQHYYPCVETGKAILSEYYFHVGRTSEGISMCKSLISHAEERRDFEMTSSIYRGISQGYLLEKDAESAFFWAEKAVAISSKSRDKEEQIKGLILLAEANLLKKSPKKSILLFLEYISKAEKLKFNRGLSSAYARLGDVYRGQNNLEKAEYYFRKSYSASQKVHLSGPTSHAINNLAIIYFEKGNTEKALSYFKQALELRLKTGDRKAICESYFNLGDYYFYTNNLNESKIWYEKSMIYAQQNNVKTELYDALSALANASKVANDLNGTIGYLEKAIAVRDQMHLEELSDEEELTQLQHEMIELEAKTELKMENENFFQKHFKIEWVIILALSVVLFLLLAKRKRTT